MKKVLTSIRSSNPLKELKWFDLFILTIIFFGEAIYLSTIQWLGSTSSVGTTEFTSSDNWFALFTQGKQFLLAIIYLLIRNYDFKQLKVKLEWSMLFWTFLIFVGSGLVCDLTFTLLSYIPGIPKSYNYFGYLFYYDWNILLILKQFSLVDFSTVVYSLFNGFYEEFFFLGLFLTTNQKYRSLVLLVSTIIRTLFHTYQGLVPALVIGVSFGLFYYYMYTKKNDNLLPYFFSHALADMVGISIISLIISV